MSELIGLVCARVSDLANPREDSILATCVDCSEGIWVSPDSIAKVIKHHKVSPTLVCMDCAEDEITKVGLKEVVAATVEIGIGQK